MALQKVFPKIQRARSFHQQDSNLNLSLDLSLCYCSSDVAGKEKINTYLEFVVSKRTRLHNSKDLENCKEIRTVENYHESCKLFLQIVLMLNSKYSKENYIEVISEDCIS